MGRAQPNGEDGGTLRRPGEPCPVIPESTIACPVCGHRSTEEMPTDSCVYFSGIPRMTPELRKCSRFSGLAARLTRGVDGYQQLGQPERWSSRLIWLFSLASGRIPPVDCS